jgi:quinol monooxygenase YgiN
MQRAKRSGRQAIKRMAQAVHDEEPGCLSTGGARAGKPQEIYVYEVYGRRGIQSHRASTSAMQKVFDETLDRGSFNVELLSVVAGFIRHKVATD